ncbi:hypothetical protein EYR38_009915 [Pleurotus pulmonarius]|nr:hypothetical protein EYR38_009915 [Pleurotus pulmonarius]
MSTKSVSVSLGVVKQESLVQVVSPASNTEKVVRSKEWAISLTVETVTRWGNIAEFFSLGPSQGSELVELTDDTTVF